MSIQEENGQVHDGAALDDALKAFNAALNCMGDSNQEIHFCANPEEYIWKCLGKKETLIPYCLDPKPSRRREDIDEPQYFNPNHIRWEKCNVWVVEGDLLPGESNLVARRLFYIDAASWMILFGEGFDNRNHVVKFFIHSTPTLLGASRDGRWYKIDNHGAA